MNGITTMDSAVDDRNNNDELSVALALNLKYQSSLLQQLNTLRTQLFLNLEKQRLLTSERMIKLWSKYSTGRRCAVMRREKFFDSPHFIYIINKIKNSKGNEYNISLPTNNKDTNYWLKKSKIELPENECVKSSAFQKYFPIFHLSKNISRIEKNIIITSARMEYIEKAKQKIYSDKNYDQENVERNNKLRSKLLKLDSCAPIDIDSSLLDWNRICTYFIIKHKNKLSDDIQMVKYREINEYETIWYNYILCDNSSWSKEEISTLNTIAMKYNGHNWIKIHSEFIDALKSKNMYKNRTCLSIFKFYQQSINKIHTRHDWTRNDDEILILISKKYGENDHMSQSFYLDRRLPHQCAARLQHATGTDKVIWTKSQDLTLLLLVKSFIQSKTIWSKARDFLTSKTDSQCRERYNHYLKNVCNHDINQQHLLNVQQVIFIINLLIKDGYNLWSSWCDISYILNWYEYNYWHRTWKKWKCKQDVAFKDKHKNIKHALRKAKLTMKYSKELLKLRKDKLQNHKYFLPSVIAEVFCIFFGGKSGHKLFDDGFKENDYPRDLLNLFIKIKDMAIQCQLDGQNNDDDNIEIGRIKKEIELFVNDERFKFDKLIENVVGKTIYFDDKLDPIQNYKFLYKLENVS